MSDLPSINSSTTGADTTPRILRRVAATIGGCHYSPALKDDSIRLLRILPRSKLGDIHCTLESHTLCDDTKYTALSYHWGNVAVTKEIRLNGCAVRITTNLWNALRAIIEHYAEVMDTFLWVDAICINQGNVKERNHQVHQMWKIFSSAQEVFAWLGPEDESTPEAFAIIEEIANSCLSTSEPACSGWRKHHPTAENTAMIALNALFSREYFKRTWVIQEVVQARELRLVCGRHSTTSSKLYHLQKVCSGSQASELFHNRYLHKHRIEDRWTPLEAYARLANTFFTYSRSHCTNPRGRVFAFIGDPVIRALDPEMKLKPDYELDLQQVALLFALYCDELLSDLCDTYGQGNVPSLSSLEPYLNSLLHSISNALQVGRWHVTPQPGLSGRDTDTVGPLTQLLVDGKRSLHSTSQCVDTGPKREGIDHDYDDSILPPGFGENPLPVFELQALLYK